MASATHSRRRSLLYLAALLFGAATAFYSIVWVYYVPGAGFKNIGAEFTYSLPAHYLRVGRVFQGSNAQQAGLRPGDEILAINGTKLDRLTPYYEFVDRGRPGDTVEFLVQRPGGKSPRILPLVLRTHRAIELYRFLSPSRVLVLQILRSYPIFFLVVGV